ncbi:MAG: nuclear transport factor 2 family protein [Rhizobiales bacterium]|nr:nuclear transport factor 2 family protein [Hyphomicrobiales bacterium]
MSIHDGADVVSVVGDYYDSMIANDEAGLRRVFHPKAQIAGHFGGALEIADLDQFVSGAQYARSGDGPFEWRLDGLILLGDTAVVTVTGYCFGAWITDHVSLLRIEGQWRIIGKTYYVRPEGS